MKYINYRIKQCRTEDEASMLLLKYGNQVRTILKGFKNFGRVYEYSDVYADIYIKLKEKDRILIDRFFIEEKYFCRFVKNICIDIQKSEKKRQLSEIYKTKVERKNMNWLEYKEDRIKRINDNDEWEYLSKILSDNEKKVFVLHTQGYKHKEISEKLNISKDASKQRNKRAKDKLFSLRA